tara:strand:- start:52 stop:1065 length:1014 start_codon:yes stop_codon:yes gene_type:complete
LKKKRILFAILNWGLGHATRSWELIHKYINEGHQITLASDGVAKDFLKLEFPYLKLEELPSYNAVYGERGSLFEMIKNGFKTQLAVKDEKVWLEEYLKKNECDLIISDNRYGIYDDSIKSIIITHQLNIKSPLASKLVNKQNHSWLNNFNEIWVPDSCSELSGELSSPIPSNIKTKVKEIGWLSRFKGLNTSDFGETILAVVSGPEPQKSILAQKLEQILLDLDLKSTLYTGDPKKQEQQLKGKLTIKSHSLSNEFAQDLLNAKVVIGRSGYSSLMDYKIAGKKMVLIPTPGQDEQNYLGDYLKSDFRVRLIPQEKLTSLSLQIALNSLIAHKDEMT